jgi:uncharacterized membrane protein YheB (UPF0754 family)
MIKWIKSLIEDSVRNAVAEQVKDAVATAVAEQIKTAMVSVAEKVENVEIDYDDLANSLISSGLDYHQIASNIELGDLAAEIDTSDIENRVVEQVDMDEVVQGVVDAIDTDDIAEKVKDNIEIDYSEIEIDYAQLGKALVALVARSV